MTNAKKGRKQQRGIGGDSIYAPVDYFDGMSEIDFMVKMGSPSTVPLRQGWFRFWLLKCALLGLAVGLTWLFT